MIALRFKTEIFDPEKTKTSYLTWRILSQNFKVPMGWLMSHCSDRLKRAIVKNENRAFVLMAQDKEEPKPKRFISKFLKRNLTKTNLL